MAGQDDPLAGAAPAEPRAALAGIRVLEVTQFEVGTMCGQQLAWLGADVVKVEQPGVGDLSRRSPGFFSTLNSSKRAITLDLGCDEGRAVFLDLVRWADVVIENQKPGAFEAWGLSYDELRAVNRGVVLARAKGFGTYGPYASYKSFDMIAQATSGAMSASGPAGGEPTLERFPIADNATGIHLALAIMAALWQRRTTGSGQEVECSLQDTMLSMGRMWFSHVLNGAPTPPPRGNRLGTAGGLFACAPGGAYDYVYVYCHPARRAMWDALFATIGYSGPASTASGREAEARYRDEADAIDDALVRWTASRSKFEAMEVLASAGVPCGAVLDAREVMADPHVRAREMLVDLHHEDLGQLTILGSPIKLADSPAVISAAPLRLGEHNDDVLIGVLGYTPERVAALRRRAVI